jgi:hypothetical protein
MAGGDRGLCRLSDNHRTESQVEPRELLGQAFKLPVRTLAENSCHAELCTASTVPSGSLESRSSMPPGTRRTSTQSPMPLKELFLHGLVCDASLRTVTASCVPGMGSLPVTSAGGDKAASGVHHTGTCIARCTFPVRGLPVRLASP